MSRETQPKETQPKETQPTAADPTVDTLTAVQSWSTQDAEELFHLPAWGSGYFFVNEEGHVAVRPVWNQDISFDLFEVAQELKARGIQFPMLIRLQDLLNTRVVRLNEAFRKAIAVTGFRNSTRASSRSR